MQDAAAGRRGKCPVCGTWLVIPSPDPVAAVEPVSAAVEPIDSESGRIGSRAHPASTTTTPPPVAEPDVPDFILDPPAAAPAVGSIRFEAIGEAWGLYQQRAGVWALAAFLTAIGGTAVQFGLFFLSIPVSIAGGIFLGGALSPLIALGSLAVSLAAWGVFLGGMYRMALRQVDGRPIGVKDMIPGAEILPSLALASLMAGLATFAGFFFLMIPGFVVAGLLMFALPLIIDGRLAALDAIGASGKALKDHWLAAGVLMLVLWTLQIAGTVACGLGALVTLPLAFLTQAILYRGFFPRGGASKKPIPVEIDPDFGPIAASARPRGRIPAWAWLTAAAGLLMPVVAAGLGMILMVGLFTRTFRGFNGPDPRFARAFRDFEQRRLEMERGRGRPVMLMPVPPAAVVQERMRKMMEQQRAGAGPQAPADPRRPAAGLDPTPLLVHLNGGDDAVRTVALERLARFAPDAAHHDAVIQALEPLLSAANPELRAAAVKSLGAWANQADVPALIRLLDDGEPAIRRQALLALGRFPDARAVPFVARHLAYPDARTQSDAVRVLRHMGAIAEGEVVRYLEVRDAPVRDRACQVLQAIGTRASIPALSRLASDRSTASRAAQAALRAINARERRR